MSTEPRFKPDGSRVKAIGLVSGGLDSTLAVKVIRDLGIEVIAINFSTGFCRSDHHRAMGSFGADQDPKRLRNEALRAGADLGIPVRVVDISEKYMDVILKPRHGYGANMNPCIDCRAFMLKAARLIMEEESADFVFTGEVLGQRPMSQHLRAMKVIEKDAGLQDRLLRPLSAQLLAATLPEREGWVDRDSLLRLQGRTRKPQLKLAREAKLVDVPSPAGGCCYLTDEVYSSRFHDHLMHLPEGAAPNAKDVLLMKVGRHFRIDPKIKFVVARDEAECNFLTHFFPETLKFEAAGVPGPLAVAQIWPGYSPTTADREIMARLVARYGKGKDETRVKVVLRDGDNEEVLEVAPLTNDAEIDTYRIPEKFDPWERRK
jgi:tRNA-uridine 2-sulfurtransferase